MEIIIKNNMHSIIDKNVALDESIKISKKESTRIMNIKPLKMLFLILVANIIISGILIAIDAATIFLFP